MTKRRKVLTAKSLELLEEFQTAAALECWEGDQGTPLKHKRAKIRLINAEAALKRHLLSLETSVKNYKKKVRTHNNAITLA